MGDTWGWLLLVGQFVVPVAVLGAVVYLVARFLKRHPPPAGAVKAAQPPCAAPRDPAERRTARRAAVVIGVTGFCLPWVVGLAVKLWLDAHGEPTYPLSSFLAPTALVILVAATVGQWSWPFLVLAWWVASRHFPRFAPGWTFSDRLLLARAAHGAGLAAGLAVFVPVFREWDVMYIFVPLGFFLLLPMAAGYGVGLVALRRRDGRRRTSP